MSKEKVNVKKRPMIGLTSSGSRDSFYLRKTYVKAVTNAGGLPFIIPFFDERDFTTELVSILDGLILTGGLDLDPFSFGEQPLKGIGEIEPLRDKFEIILAKKVLEEGVPLLGICKGCQIMNVAAGGNIYQDIYFQLETTIEHRQKSPSWYSTHDINIMEKSKLYKIVKKNKITVNSFHHQAVMNPAPGFKPAAVAEDGIIEAIEAEDNRFALGVQWHPEALCKRSKEALNIFKKFIMKAYQKASQ